MTLDANPQAMVEERESSPDAVVWQPTAPGTRVTVDARKLSADRRRKLVDRYERAMHSGHEIQARLSAGNSLSTVVVMVPRLGPIGLLAGETAAVLAPRLARGESRTCHVSRVARLPGNPSRITVEVILD